MGLLIGKNWLNLTREIKKIYDIKRRSHENCVRFLCKRKTKRSECSGEAVHLTESMGYYF